MSNACTEGTMASMFAESYQELFRQQSRLAYFEMKEIKKRKLPTGTTPDSLPAEDVPIPPASIANNAVSYNQLDCVATEELVDEGLTNLRDAKDINGVSYYLTPLMSLASRRFVSCLLYTSPSPRDRQKSRMPSSA